MKITIVIATYNRGGKLLRTLRSLTAQTLPPSEWEAVVVNNNSSDDTTEIFTRFAQGEGSAINTRMVDEPRQGLSWARNRGIVEARGEIMVMVDDDEEVNPEFAAVWLDFFDRHPEVMIAGGKVTPVYETGRPRWMSRFTERPIAGTLDLGPCEKPFTRGYPAGGNMAVRRQAFDKYGMFHIALGRTGGSPVGDIRRADVESGGVSTGSGKPRVDKTQAGKPRVDKSQAGKPRVDKSLLGGEEKELFIRIVSGRDAEGCFVGSGGKAWWVPDAVIYHIIPPEKLTLDYMRRLSFGVGASERVRVASRGTLLAALLGEACKWGATLAIAAWFVLTLHPSKARYLILMRSGITRGLICGQSGSKIAAATAN